MGKRNYTHVQALLPEIIAKQPILSAQHEGADARLNTPPETVPLDRTNGALRPLKWCMVTAVMVH